MGKLDGPPYFQLNGTSTDGGLMWIDDISTDNMWNSTLTSSLAKEVVTTPVLSSNMTFKNGLTGHKLINNKVKFTIQLSQSDNIRLNLFDLYGRKVWSYSADGTEGINTIRMNRCAPGHYILKMNLEKGNLSESKKIEILD